MFTLISSQRLFCNIYQIQAIFYDNPDALAEISGLIGIGQFLAHSDYGSMPEYLESRNEKFKHAQQNHPEFFSKQHNQLLDIPLDTMGKSVETTGFIEAGLNEFVESKKSLLSDTLETNDAKMLQSSEEWLIETLNKRDKEALTFDIFEQSSLTDRRPQATGAVRRALSLSYIGSYAEPFDPVFIWGYQGLNRFERFGLLTGFNLAFAKAVFRNTGLDAFLTARPAYGQIDRLNCAFTQEAALFRQRYKELAAYLDRNANLSADAYHRTSEVKESIQNILQQGTLSPRLNYDTFRDGLLVASNSLKRTLCTLRNRHRPPREPRLYALYPEPKMQRHSAQPRLSKPSSGSSTPKPPQARFLAYDKFFLYTAPVLALLAFGSAFWWWQAGLLISSAGGIGTGAFWGGCWWFLHPTRYYRRWAAAGFLLLSVGGWSWKLDAQGEVAGANYFTWISSEISAVATVMGGLIVIVALLLDFFDRRDVERSM